MTDIRVVKCNALLSRFVTAATLAVALFAHAGSASAQIAASVNDGCPGTADTWFGDCPNPEGSWLYTVTIPTGGTPFVFQGLETYAGGGGYTEADLLSVVPAPSFATAGHGVWKMTGERTFLLTYMNLTYDVNGNPTGTLKVRQTTRISKDGKAYTGSGDYAYYDTNGGPGAGGSGTFTITATRILVEKPQ